MLMILFMSIVLLFMIYFKLYMVLPALSFSEKSAATIQSRVDLNVPLSYNDCQIRTFHAAANELVQLFASEIHFSRI